MEKAEARRRVQEAVAGLSPQARVAKSAAIRERVRALAEVSGGGTVMGFLPMRDEIDTRPILEDLIAAGKRVYVPRSFAEGHRMVPVRLAGLDRLRKGLYGISEPHGDETCAVQAIDIMLVPGRAFDGTGNRLGRGAGFYDLFMCRKEFRAVRVGLAFDCQVLPDVPHDTHDLPVHMLVTETQTLRFGRLED